MAGVIRDLRESSMSGNASAYKAAGGAYGDVFEGRVQLLLDPLRRAVEVAAARRQ